MHGVTFLTRQAQMLQRAIHRRQAHRYARLSGHACAQVRSCRIREFSHQSLDACKGGRVQAWGLAICLRLWGDVTGDMILAEHFLNKRKADTEHVSDHGLRAEVPLTGARDLLT
jgi:hypothetical protein